MMYGACRMALSLAALVFLVTVPVARAEQLRASGGHATRREQNPFGSLFSTFGLGGGAEAPVAGVAPAATPTADAPDEGAAPADASGHETKAMNMEDRAVADLKASVRKAAAEAEKAEASADKAAMDDEEEQIKAAAAEAAAAMLDADDDGIEEEEASLRRHRADEKAALAAERQKDEDERELEEERTRAAARAAERREPQAGGDERVEARGRSQHSQHEVPDEKIARDDEEGQIKAEAAKKNEALRAHAKEDDEHTGASDRKQKFEEDEQGTKAKTSSKSERDFKLEGDEKHAFPDGEMYELSASDEAAELSAQRAAEAAQLDAPKPLWEQRAESHDVPDQATSTKANDRVEGVAKSEADAAPLGKASGKTERTNYFSDMDFAVADRGLVEVADIDADGDHTDVEVSGHFAVKQEPDESGGHAPAQSDERLEDTLASSHAEEKPISPDGVRGVQSAPHTFAADDLEVSVRQEADANLTVHTVPKDTSAPSAHGWHSLREPSRDKVGGKLHDPSSAASSDRILTAASTKNSGDAISAHQTSSSSNAAVDAHTKRPHRPHHRHRQRSVQPDDTDEQRDVQPDDTDVSPAPAPPAAPLRPAAPDSHLQSYNYDPEVKPSAPPCNPETEECERSMCRWLKMSSRDSKGRCTLFEWQLRSCNYGLPEIRKPGSQPEPIDCAIDILRRGGVQAPQVPGYVRELDTCLANIPPQVNSTCYVALGLLHSEIAEWKKEASLKDDVEVVKQELRHVTVQGQIALDQQEREQPAIEALTHALEKAEPLPGHYLVEEVRAARGILNRLVPIPALHKELVRAEADAKNAFETTSLWRVKEAIVWLNVSVRKAEKYKLIDPVNEGKKALHNLEVLKAALLDLKHAKFQANVSIGTKSGVLETLAMLNSSIHKAKAAGLSNGMLSAHSLLRRLQLLQDAVQASADSTATANEILAVAGNKGERSLLIAASALNASLAQAENLGLGDNSTIANARAAYDEVLYILHARRALQDAVRNSQDVLDHNGAVLSDDREEAAIAGMAPAIAWGDDVGLVNGLDVAQLARDMLLAVEHAKENMTRALAIGNATIVAKTRVPEAITVLEAAVAGSLQFNTSAGVREAQEELKVLHAIWDARVALEAATNQAREAMRTRAGYDQAVIALNVSGHRAGAVGLDDEARLAADQLTHLQEFARADEVLKQSLSESPPARGPPQQVQLQDPEPRVTFRRDGLEVMSLPAVPGGADDGDRDFDEHIGVLAKGIEDAALKGSVDPKMQATYQSALGMRAAYEMLMASEALGEAAMASKAGVAEAIAALTTALREAHERGLAIDVAKASELYTDLSKILPAIEKIRGAMLACNVSIRTTSGMDGALVKIQSALELNRQLGLTQYVPAAEKLRADLLVIKEAYVSLRAATMQGKIALENESGEEAAIVELGRAIAIAHQAGLTKGVEDAQELHVELEHMSSQHNRLQDAMSPPLS